MKVILLNNMKTLGKKGEIKEVKSGYARNFLIPHKFALSYDHRHSQALIRAQELEKKKQIRKDHDIDVLLNKLTARAIRIKLPKNEKGRLFAALRPKEMVEYLKNNDIIIDEKMILLKQAIKEAGEYRVRVQLDKDKQTTFKLIIE